jgi:general secretion pathway protein B
MSYILDALKKAEADRKLGEAVSLHDPAPAPAPNWVEPTDTASHTSVWLMAGAGGTLAACLGLVLGAWWWSSASSSQPSQADLPPQASLTAPIGRPASSGAPTHMGVATVPSPAMPAADSVQLPMPARASPPTKHTNKPSNGQTTAAPSSQQPEPLPASIRQQLPALVVGGAMYADVPANRMVVINGNVLHEGDAISPGLVLENIALKAATVRYQGKVYVLTY